jgi:hypothetical protein
VAEESEGRKLLNRLREATANVTQMTKEGVETLQVKRELSQCYAELGRKTAGLV